MCTGAEFTSGLNAGSSVLGGIGALTTAVGHRAQGDAARSFGNAQASLAEADAFYEQDAAAQQAEKILRAAQRQKGAARAATAASGTRIDEFSMATEDAIEQLAQEDAAMTILSGERRARSIRYGGEMARLAGENRRSASLFRSGTALMEGLSGWRGAKSTATAEPEFDPIGDFYLRGNRGAGD